MLKKNPMKSEQEKQLKRALHWQTAVDNSMLTTSPDRRLQGSNKGIALVSIHVF